MTEVTRDKTPLWEPSLQRRERSHMKAFWLAAESRTGRKFSNYQDLHRWSVTDLDGFWGEAAAFLKVRWQNSPRQTFIPPPAGKMRGGQWFPGATLNYAQNLLTDTSDRVRITAVAEGVSSVQQWTGRDLHNAVARCAHGLQALGVGRGDRVCGVVANIPESIIAMLATASLGAVWASCSPDFGAPGIVDRFGQVEPKVLFFCKAYQYNGRRFDCLPTMEEVRRQLPTLVGAIAIDHLSEGADKPTNPWYTDWSAWLSQQELTAGGDGRLSLAFEAVPFDHPLFIMFSSGTTGIPKCIVHSVGGTLLQHKKELMLHSDLKQGQRLLYFTTCGWMMWNWMVSTLSTEADLALFEGSPGYPDMGVLWRVVNELGVTHLGISPKYIASCMAAGVEPKAKGINRLETILSTGSPLLPEHFAWVYDKVGGDIHLASISGGTDIISCFMLGNPLLPVYSGEIQCLGLGMALEAWSDEGISVTSQKAELVCTKPFVSMPIGFWNDPDDRKYSEAYFNFYSSVEVWRHGDFIEITPRGGVVVYGRSDATLNPGGVRIGTAEIYRQVEAIPGVVDSLAVGLPRDGDVDIVLFVKWADRSTWRDTLKDEIKGQIRTSLTPRHVPRWIFPVLDIPYTRSGKKLELAVLTALQGKPVTNISAIANPESLQEYYEIGRGL